MLLSIIVPVYDVEPYVERCIRSLEDQDISKADYEIIVVNDGSPDNSRDVVIRLQKEFDNIILIDQENQGVSAARNNALKIARGKYMMPIDPDDYVLTNTFKLILDKATQQDLDLLFLGFVILNSEGQIFWKTNYSKLTTRTFNGPDAYFAHRGPYTRDPDRSVATLYRMNLLKKFNIGYPRDVPYLEDGLFLGKIGAVADRCGFDNEPFYQRTTREGSATNSTLFYSERAREGFLKAAADLKKFQKQHSLSEKQADLINHVTAKFILLPLSSSIGTRNIAAFKKIKNQIVTAGFGKLELKGCRGIYLLFGKHFNVSINWFYLYYHYYRRMESCKLKVRSILQSFLLN